MRKIPKKIHYCWFGRGEKPANISNYISGWKEKLPDYEIIEWNGDNFDIEGSCAYVREAYNAHKYAFVSDYVRIKALYEQGGVYLDTDIDVVKNFDEHLDEGSIVTGFESERSLLTAFIAAEPGNEIIKEFLDSYNNRKFLNEDGSMDLTVINEGFSKLLEKNGINLSEDIYQETESGIKVYPTEVFCGFDVKNWHAAITDKTCTVHYMNSSWVGGKAGFKRKVIAALQKLIGTKNYDKLRKTLRG